jgi:signal transduction histidine kinase
VETLLEDLKHEPELPPTLVEFRDEVLPDTIDGIRRVNSIVGDLRRFARGEPEHFVPYDLTAEISAAARMARTQMKPDQILEVDVPTSIEMVGSPRQICQVVLNLIMNALQALPGRGKVSLSAATVEGGAVEVSVRDNGSGMSEETRRRLFEPFFTTKAREGLGLGLGLSVVYGIVKAHGGSIDVESALGRGSCFRMRLPRHAGAGSAARPPRALAVAASA